jgi:hypothetical protein
MVFDGVTAAAWAADAAACNPVFANAVVGSIDVVTQSSQVGSIQAADADSRRRRLIGGGGGGFSSEALPILPGPSSAAAASSRGLLSSTRVTFQVVVEADPDLPSVANASQVFKHVTQSFLTALGDGGFAAAVATAAANAGSSTMAASSVNVAASEAAVAAYSTYYEVIVHRYPTHFPTHSRPPTRAPTKQPAVPTGNDDAAAATDDIAAAGCEKLFERTPLVSPPPASFSLVSVPCLVRLPASPLRARASGGALRTRGSSSSSRSKWPSPSRSASAA